MAWKYKVNRWEEWIDMEDNCIDENEIQILISSIPWYKSKIQARTVRKKAGKGVNVLSRPDGSVMICCEVVRRKGRLFSLELFVSGWSLRELCCHLWSSSENQQPFLILQSCPFIDDASAINGKSAWLAARLILCVHLAWLRDSRVN